MKIVRLLLALAAIAAALYAIRVRSVPQYRCNRELALVEQRIDALGSVVDEARIAAGTRENMAVLLRCREVLPTSVHVRKFIADNYLLREDHENARAGYLETLQVDRRPEIYHDLAVAALRTGRIDEAREHFITASLVSPWYMQEMVEPLKSEVYSVVDQSFKTAAEREKQLRR